MQPEKDVRHIEIDLGDSGLRYQPGAMRWRLVSERSGLVKELVDVVAGRW